VVEHLKSTNTVRQGPAQEVVQTSKEPKIEKIKSIKFHSIQDVYNMEVETHHNYAVEGGLIIHNCIDSLRYSCSKFYKQKPKKKAPLKKSINTIKAMGL